jgi:hypothetical protein
VVTVASPPPSASLGRDVHRVDDLRSARERPHAVPSMIDAVIDIAASSACASCTAMSP